VLSAVTLRWRVRTEPPLMMQRFNLGEANKGPIATTTPRLPAPNRDKNGKHSRPELYQFDSSETTAWGRVEPTRARW
jgi:hypothetical protein